VISAGRDEFGRLYVLVCDRCGDDHRSHLTARTASALRHLVRRDGWRAPTGKKHREKEDLCPTCQRSEVAEVEEGEELT
jgi:hypothetical protein